MSSRRVLVVDDQREILDVVRVALDVTTDWDLLMCASVEEAEALAADDPVDVALLDLSAARDDPTGAVQRLRQATGGAPVVLLTATSLDDPEVRRTGASGLIAKPFDPMSLAQDIALLLGWPVDS